LPPWEPGAYGGLPAHLAQPAERELDPDREEQQDHANLGEAFDALHVGDETERVRADEHAATMNPGRAGRLRRRNTRITISDIVKMTARSLRTRTCSTVPSSVRVRER
jgi:hypothetical protein